MDIPKVRKLIPIAGIRPWVTQRSVEHLSPEAKRLNCQSIICGCCGREFEYWMEFQEHTVDLVGLNEISSTVASMYAFRYNYGKQAVEDLLRQVMGNHVTIPDAIWNQYNADNN